MGLSYQLSNRIVEIKDKILKYYKHDESNTKERCGTINFQLYQCFAVLDKDNPKQLNLSVKGNKREFIFQAATEEEAISWLTIINANISASMGHKRAIEAPDSEFWLQDQISEQ